MGAALMQVEWAVAKYMPDLRRREPANIGVIVRVGETWLARFMGEKIDGRIDGRAIRWVQSADNYRSWIDYWRDRLDRQPDSVSELASGRVGDENYFLEVGGERLVGSSGVDASAVLERLYSMLVEESPDKESLSVAKLSDSVLNQIGILDRVERAFRLDVPLESGARDSVIFDYRYENGISNLMQRVTLTFEDDRSWDSVHAAAWNFERAHAVSSDHQLIALFKAREPDAELGRQIGVLAQYAAAIDVAREKQAASELAHLLRI